MSQAIARVNMSSWIHMHVFLLFFVDKQNNNMIYDTKLS